MSGARGLAGPHDLVVSRDGIIGFSDNGAGIRGNASQSAYAPHVEPVGVAGG